MLDTEFMPSEQPGSTRLMIVLHGLGDSTAGFRWLPATLELPWMNYLLVNAPDTYYGGYSWYDFTGDMTAGVKRSSKMLFELLEFQRTKGFPTDQTTLFGFSQGCLMTLEVGLRYPHRFAGLIGISGYVSDPDVLAKELSPVAHEQRLLVTHGFQDPIVPFANTREQINILKATGLHLAWHEFDKGHTIAPERELEIIRDFIVAGYPSAAAPATA